MVCILPVMGTDEPAFTVESPLPPSFLANVTLLEDPYQSPYDTRENWEIIEQSSESSKDKNFIFKLSAPLNASFPVQEISLREAFKNV